MFLSTDGLIDEDLVNHTKYTISNGEIISYYVDKKKGSETLERYQADANGNLIYIDSIKTINEGHSEEKHNVIINLFDKLDQIIDLDFAEMSHNNG